MSKKAHNAVNIISIISMLGVVVTTAALICVLSVFNGFQGHHHGASWRSSTPRLPSQPAVGKVMPDGDSVVRVVRRIPGVQQAMPVVVDNALAIFADFQMPVRLKGVPDDYNKMTAIDSIIVEGDFQLRDQVSRYAVLGAGPAMTSDAEPPGYLLPCSSSMRRNAKGAVNMATTR